MTKLLTMCSEMDIPIVTASDENYVPCLKVMLRSVMDTISKDRRGIFFVIDDDLSSQSKDELEALIDAYSGKAAIEFLTVNRGLYEEFMISDHINTTAYLRISLPELLENSPYNKVLYLDSDTFVLTDVAELYDQNLGDHIIGAVIDPGQAKALARLEVDSHDYYFNSGVMLVDLDQWRKNNVTEKTIQFLEEKEQLIVFHDQDALNAILHDNWKQLHPKWNMQTSLMFDVHPAPTKYYDYLYQSGRNKPAIVHFTGHDKPWNTLENHPYQEQYMQIFTEDKSYEVGVSNE